MTAATSSSPPARRLRPLEAFRAMGRLLRDPDDTAEVFRVIDALSGNSGERVFQRFRRTEAGARILAERRDLLTRLQDRAWLEAQPEGSLARHYADFMRRGAITPDGLVEASEARPSATDDPDRLRVGARLRDMHDLWHVATGYDRDLLGEAALLAFTYAQTRNRGIGFIVAMAYWKSLRAGGPFRAARRLIRQGYRRGRRAVWLPAEDWEALLPLPLTEVRARLQLDTPPQYEPIPSPQTANAAAAP